MKAFKALLKTEISLSLRGMDMFIFAICMPFAVIVILGSIFGSKPAFKGAEYTFLQQSFGAVSTIAVCAGGVMGLPLVVSEYRSRKILKRFQVTPVSPALILAVQVTVCALYSFASLILVDLAGALFFGCRMQGHWLSFIGAYLLVMVSLFSMGILVGGLAPNTKIAGVAASLMYFPMLIFSWATLPYEVMPSALQKAADFLPLTQGIKLLKAVSLNLPVNDIALPVLVMLAIAVVCTGLSLLCFQWGSLHRSFSPLLSVGMIDCKEQRNAEDAL